MSLIKFATKYEERKDTIQLFIDTIKNTLVQSTKLCPSSIHSRRELLEGSQRSFAPALIM